MAEALRHDYHIIAPDLRGHGDSQWMLGGSYNQLDYVYDIAQLVRQIADEPITIIGHSLGGAISLTYTGLYPERVRKLIAIEGLGPSPAMLAARLAQRHMQRCPTFSAIDVFPSPHGRETLAYTPNLEQIDKGSAYRLVDALM